MKPEYVGEERRARPAKPALPLWPAGNGSEPAPRILVVDDGPDRLMLTRHLEARGLACTAAEGGARALELVAAEPFDLVLLDIVMPDVNGLEVLRRIREHHSPLALPVVMVTGRVRSDDIVEALTLGANDYITKPVDFPIALARISTQIGRKRADEALRKAMLDAQAASRAKSEFLANMSHEIRTPLNGVLGVAQVLSRTRLDEQQKQLLGVIADSADTLNRLLADLLDLAQAEAGRFVLRPEPFDLGEAVRWAAAMWEAKARQKNLAFKLYVSPHADTVVNGDAVRLKQILTNLLSNAVKFTEEGEVRLNVYVSEGVHRFEVCDTGLGMKEEDISRLFQRFEQADGSMTRRFGGSGLGLAIASDLAALMGGSLTCSSVPGRGSVFTLEVPFAAGEGEMGASDEGRRRSA